MYSLFNKCSVFISHKRNEGKVSFDATWFASALKEKNSYKVFMDIHEDYIGNFPKVLAEKVKSCNVFLLVLPSDRDLNYLCDEKNWVHKEILYALRKIEYDENSIKILPVSFKDNITFPPKEKLGEIAAISDYSILYCDINDQERSKQKLYNAIGYKSKNSIYTWASIMLLVVCFIIGLFMKKELMPNILFDDEDAVALFELANKQSEDHENIKAMNSYKKVKDYWESQNKYTRDYFHSYFMYLEFSRDFMEGHYLVSEYKNIINGIEQNVKFEFLSESDAIVYNRIKALTEFKLGYDYFYKIHNLDSAWYYMNQTEQYFIETKDSAKLKEIDKIKQKWTIQNYKVPESIETNKSKALLKHNNNTVNQSITNQNKADKETEKTSGKTIKQEYSHIKELLKNTKSCRTGSFNEKGDGVIIWGRNSFAYTTGIPEDMKNTLEKIKIDNEYINDVYINNNQEWCIVWGINFCETNFPSQIFNQHIKDIKRDNKKILSIAFNDIGDHIIITNTGYNYNGKMQKEFTEKVVQKGKALSISMTNTSILVCCEDTIFSKNLPDSIKDIITKNREYKKNIRFTDNGNYLLTDGLRGFTHNFK